MSAEKAHHQPNPLPRFKKVQTSGFARVYLDESLPTTDRLVGYALSHLTLTGCPFERGEARRLFGRDADRAIRRVKAWGMLGAESSAAGLSIPQHLAWSGREYVDRDGLQDESRWVAMPKTAASAAIEAFGRGMPLWLALSIVAQSQATAEFGEMGMRALHTSRAQIGELFFTITKDGEIKPVTAQAIKLAISTAVSHGLLLKGSTASRLLVAYPGTNHG